MNNIYFIRRTLRKNRKTGVSFESRIFAFHVELEPMMKLARNLSSRYKKRFIVSVNHYEDNILVSSKAICAYECKGKGHPVVITR